MPHPIPTCLLAPWIILALFRTSCPSPQTHPAGKQRTSSACSPILHELEECRSADPFLSPRDSYVPRDTSLQSETVHYKRGVCQQFCVPSHTVDPSEWTEEEVSTASP